ncbi:CRISPR-associated helicase Cas3' [Clostridium botulinum]|nr:CRISPR-associated helicase Cas3' [Clostridium botulinum]
MKNIKEYLVNVNEIIKDIDKMYGHISTDNSKEPEYLLKHLDLVIDKYIMFDKHNGVMKKVEILVDDILINANVNRNINIIKEFIIKAFLNALYLHDIGKASIGYQVGVLKNNNFKELYNVDMSNNHSPYSTRIYLDLMCGEVQILIKSKVIDINSNDVFLILYMVGMFSYCIQKHHSRLENVTNFLTETLKTTLYKELDNGKIEFITADKYEELIMYVNPTNKAYAILSLEQMISNGLDKVLDNIKEHLYLLNRLLFSALVTADSLATSEYMNNTKIEFSNFNIDEAIKEYRESKLYKSIKHYYDTGEIDSEINAIRCDILKEVDTELSLNINKNILYLESPTGSGKTNISTYVGLRTMELTKNKDNAIQRFIYTAPFNSITTQTTRFLEDIFKSSNIDTTLVNSATPIKVNGNNNEELIYELSLLDYQMLNYPITLTSHVKLFSILFGTSRLDNHSLINLFNSIIIIDEVQAYNPTIWPKMIKLMDIYAKYMNIKFVIMSATLPRLGELINKENIVSSYGNLVKDSSIYFKNKCFKNRISNYNYDMIEDSFLKYKISLSKEEYREKCFRTIVNKIRNIYKKKNAKILVECITKDNCRQFYKYIKNENLLNEIKDNTLSIEELTSEDNDYIRQKIINKARHSENIILVCTQCIEAGVDLDMDYGWKNISYIDSEEQFAGRICRNYREGRYGEVNFFLLDNADDIYSNGKINFKSDFNILNLKYRKVLENKNFEIVFKDMINSINKKIRSSNEDVSINKFNFLLQKLDYKGIEKALMLIEEKQEYTLFFPFNIDLELENNIINIKGKDIWNKFKDSFKGNNYAKKKIDIKNSMCDLSYFCYKYSFKGSIEQFEDMLNNKDIYYECIAGIYCLMLTEDEISTIINPEYKFNKEIFDRFQGNLII